MKDPERKRKKAQAVDAVHQIAARLREWDPIGAPVDEYDSSARHIVSLLAAGVSESELAGHLEHVRTLEFGLAADPSRALRCAREILASWRAGCDAES